MLTLKKSLGQHFLIDESVCRRIVEAVGGTQPRRLLEVGPGGGALTKYLLGLPTDLRCVEIDQEKAAFLLRTYPALAGRLVVGDILSIDPPFDGSFSVVGNFPYNISTEIVFRLIDWKDQIDGMTGMFQKEVAQRLAAGEGSKVYGVTSVLVQAWFRVDYLFDVPPEAFRPPPKVTSAVIRLTPLTEPLEMRDARALKRLVKAAFGQRRKTLRNAVKGLFDPQVLQEPLFNKRAEELSVQAFGALTFRMNS